MEKRAEPSMMQTWARQCYCLSLLSYGDVHHEAAEDHAQGRGACVEHRGPQEHEDVHAGLQQRLAAPQQQHLTRNIGHHHHYNFTD